MGSRNKGYWHQLIQKMVQLEGWDRQNRTIPPNYDGESPKAEERRKKREANETRNS